MYNKLFTKILDSSIWLESVSTRIVWLTFIAVMDEHGYVRMASVANLAHRARVSPEEAQAAVDVLENPDLNSSDPANEGRRIERVEGGWMVLNSDKHRDMVTRAIIQEQTRERVRKFRERKRGNAVVTVDNEKLTPSRARAIAESRVESGVMNTSSLIAIVELREAVWAAGYDGRLDISWEKVKAHHRDKCKAAWLASGWTVTEFHAGKDFGNSKRFRTVYDAEG